MVSSSDFFDIPPTPLPNDVVSEVIKTTYGFKFRVVTRTVKQKKDIITTERWFCLKELRGQCLPDFIRNGTKGKGWKSFNSFWNAMKYHLQD